MTLAARVDPVDRRPRRPHWRNDRPDRAKVFAEELAQLDDLLANCIATSLTLGAGTLTATQLRGRLRRAVLAADP